MANPYDGAPTRDFADLAARIPGWGADLPMENRPAVPKESPAPNGTGAHWDRPVKMQPTDAIMKSTEHLEMPPVFGTSCPPRGLSGVIRRFAFRYSEGRMRHWLLLLAADRVDVVEGIFSDLIHLRGPRPFKEMGLKTERLAHPPRRAQQSIAANIAVPLAVVAVVAAFLIAKD
jgi:hypothetical protein